MKKKVIEIQVMSYKELKGALEETMFKLEETQQENQRLRAILDGRCGNERPNRKTLCQLEKGHDGSHSAVVFWEAENK